jgi:phosphoglycerate dehydrogenase-like enzyme
MALAAAKRLVLEHENLKRGQFNQFTRNRMLAGRVCGIFGFGGIGAATARLMHGIGMRVHASIGMAGISGWTGLERQSG